MAQNWKKVSLYLFINGRYIFSFTIQVIFSDEQKFNLDGPDGFKSYWRDLRKEPSYFSKWNFGGGSLMVWGAFCHDQIFDLEVISSRVNSEQFTNVIEKNLLPFFEENVADGWNFQLDNASIHTSKFTRSWFQRHNINVLEWLSCLPDINPMENLWGCLVRQVFAENSQFQTQEELRTAIMAAWTSTKDDVRINLIKSMPNRIFDLITKKGRATRY